MEYKHSYAFVCLVAVTLSAVPASPLPALEEQLEEINDINILDDIIEALKLEAETVKLEAERHLEALKQASRESVEDYEDVSLALNSPQENSGDQFPEARWFWDKFLSKGKAKIGNLVSQHASNLKQTISDKVGDKVGEIFESSEEDKLVEEPEENIELPNSTAIEAVNTDLDLASNNVPNALPQEEAGFQEIFTLDQSVTLQENKEHLVTANIMVEGTETEFDDDEFYISTSANGLISGDLALEEKESVTVMTSFTEGEEDEESSGEVIDLERSLEEKEEEGMELKKLEVVEKDEEENEEAEEAEEEEEEEAEADGSGSVETEGKFGEESSELLESHQTSPVLAEDGSLRPFLIQQIHGLVRDISQKRNEVNLLLSELDSIAGEI